MPTNLKKFNAQLAKVAVFLPAEGVTRMQKSIGLQALSSIVLKTPVDTGRARGNWQVTIGEPASGVVGTEDISGQATIAAGSAVIANIPPFSVLHITNNLPYIGVLEGGRSGQAPMGMVGVTIAELGGMFA